MARKLLTILVDWQWVILVLISPFLLFPSPKRSLVLIFIPLLWLLSFLQNKNKAITPLNLSFLLLLFMVLVSTWATYDIQFSLSKISGVILGMGFFFGFYFLTVARRNIIFPVLLYLAASVGLAAFALLGLRQFQKIAILQPIVQRLPRVLTNLPGAEGGFHPNEVAGSLLWVLPLMLSVFLLFLVQINHRKKVNLTTYSSVTLIAFVLLSFTSLVFVLAQSRAAYLALFFGLLLLFILYLPRKWRIPVAVMIFTILIISGWVGWQSGFFQALYEQTTVGGTTASITTLNGRVEIWSRALYGIQDFPFTGMGMNTFRKVMPILYPLFTNSTDYDIGHAHNEFLQAALDLGIPGLIAFLSIYMVSFGMLYQTWQRANSRRLSVHFQGLASFLHSRAGIRSLVIGIGSSLLAHAIYGLADAVALGAKPGILFWMLLGLAAGLHALVCGGVIIKRTS